jgi:hypothetical protein
MRVPLLHSGFRLRLPAGVALVAGALAALANGTLGFGGAAMADVILPVFGECVLGAAVLTMTLRAVRMTQDRGAWVAMSCGAAGWTAGDIFRLFAFPRARTATSRLRPMRATCCSTPAPTWPCGC